MWVGASAKRMVFLKSKLTGPKETSATSYPKACVGREAGKGCVPCLDRI
jgi:hypothetical protein